MEVKINREIRSYTESMFFGLSMRQFVFSILACAVAVGLYFLLRPYAGMETVSWMCILGAAPFAALGFISYHGMTAGGFCGHGSGRNFGPKRLYCVPTNYYYKPSKITLLPTRKMLKPDAAVCKKEVQENPCLKL